jgi:hypothetical protein
VATITNSVAVQSPQKDGRVWVHEIFTDSLGVAYDIFYLAPNATGVAAQLAADAITVLANAVANEIATNINNATLYGSLATFTFNYSTIPQNYAALRAVYATFTQTQVIMVGDALNGATAAQLETAFGITPTQESALKTQLTSFAAQAAAIRAAVGQ